MRRYSTSLKKTIYRALVWLNGPAGVRVVLLLLWLLSVVLVSDYTMKQTVATINLSTIRMINNAQISCDLAEQAFKDEQRQYKELMKMADNCIAWKPKESL